MSRRASLLLVCVMTMAAPAIGWLSAWAGPEVEPRPGDISNEVPGPALRPLDAIEAEIRMTRAEAEDLTRRVRILSAARDVRREYLHKCLRSLYKLSQGGFARLFFGAGDVRQLYVRRDGARRLIRRDMEELRALHDELQELDVEQKELTVRSGHLDQLEQEAARARARIQAGQGRVLLGLARERGKLPRPVSPGRIIVPFGREAYDRNLELFLHGAELSADPGSPVAAVAEGYVRYVGEMPGLVRGVVIEHEGGYLTVYARIDDITVASGDHILAGTILGRAPYPKIYFELALGDLPLDPGPWFGAHRRREPP